MPPWHEGCVDHAQPGLPANRVEALSDGIFAIAMTILVLEVHVPELASSADLGAALARLWPKLASYVLSFLLLGTLWVGHHFQFHYIRRTDRTLLWLNIGFLMCISFLPFCTSVVGSYPQEPLGIRIYGGTLMLAGILLYAHWAYATRRRRLCHASLEESVVRSIKNRIAVGLCVYAAAIGASFLSTTMSLLIFAAMPLAYLMPTHVDRHVGKRAE
jgi:TMEM175 potassium channel family protein